MGDHGHLTAFFTLGLDEVGNEFLREYTAGMNGEENTQPKLYAAAGISLKEIEDAFQTASDRFWEAYCRISG